MIKDAYVERDAKLELSLAAIRLTTAAFMMVWAVDKLWNVKHAQAVVANFYFWKDAPAQLLMGLGVLQVLIVLAFALGLVKFWTYGAILLMHAVTTVASVGKILPPFGPGSNILFWASVPVLAAILALFLLRDRDRLLVIGR